jgi:predicted transcriptional regulator
MRKKTPQTKDRLLTEVELEIMGILWRVEEGTVHDVISYLPPARKLAYTTVSTVLRILEQKKITSSRKEGRGHVYYPVLKKEDYEKVSLSHLMRRVFDGAPSSLVRTLLDAEGLSEAELERISHLISQRLKK